MCDLTAVAVVKVLHRGLSYALNVLHLDGGDGDLWLLKVALRHHGGLHQGLVVGHKGLWVKSMGVHGDL
jgi:hypothetical protein